MYLFLTPLTNKPKQKKLKVFLKKKYIFVLIVMLLTKNENLYTFSLPQPIH